MLSRLLCDWLPFHRKLGFARLDKGGYKFLLPRFDCGVPGVEVGDESSEDGEAVEVIRVSGNVCVDEGKQLEVEFLALFDQLDEGVDEPEEGEGRLLHLHNYNVCNC